MPYVALREYLPEIAACETRTIEVLPNAVPDLGLPPGHYHFVEMFCDEPGCDCRRVFLCALCSFRKEIQAVVAWGWEGPEFYAKWMKSDDPKDIEILKGPILNLGSPETEMAPAILALVKNFLLKDTAYVDRIKRHYEMLRREIDAGRTPLRQPAAGARQSQRLGRPSAVGIGRNDPCPCGSGKKYKKCCRPNGDAVGAAS